MRSCRIILGLLAVLLGVTTSRSNTTYAESTAPFGFVGQSLTSSDGVSYTLYAGDTPSFDGLPLAAYVTVPANTSGHLPLIVMLHGWSLDRNEWQSPTIIANEPHISHWNNVSFAARGYAVLSFTSRGWHDSCGPADATKRGNPQTLPAACTADGRQYWMHLADPRYEIRDAQFLIGKLVDEGIVDPDKIGVTGNSYGGAQSALLALQNNRVMLPDGGYAPWTSSAGVPLHIAAAVPRYTWSSLLHALVPNGRANDLTVASPEELSNPVGVLLESYLGGLYFLGQPFGNGFYAPSGADPSSDFTAWYDRLSQGTPFRNDQAADPTIYQAILEMNRRSPLHVVPNAKVPLFQVQGLTDPLFTPVQALLLRNHLLAYAADYPIQSFFGDVGHYNANNRAHHWAVANSLGNQFFDYFLLGRGSAPRFDVTALTTTCVGGQTDQTFTAASWQQLATNTKTLQAAETRTTSSGAPNPEGSDTDPISRRGCQTSSANGSGAAAWTFPVNERFVLLGQPRLTLEWSATGTDAALNTRLWDVAPDGKSKTLVSRGTYRQAGEAQGSLRTSFQINANAWEFQPGHTLRLEVTGNDSPYYQTNKTAVTITIRSMELELPVTAPRVQVFLPLVQR